MDDQNTNQECCPEFDLIPWDNQQFTWVNKRFIQDKVFTFLYMPINFGSVITKMDTRIRKAGGTIPDALCLSDHTSMWNMNVYCAVDKEIPEAKNMTLSGKFYSRVYEGEFKDTGKWTADFEKNTKDQGITIKKMYMWYTTCPKCAKKYSKNYVVIIGEMN